MNKKAVAYAIRHKISLGRDLETGFYFIRNTACGSSQFMFRNQLVGDVSLHPTGQSALVMMKRYVRNSANAVAV